MQLEAGGMTPVIRRIKIAQASSSTPTATPARVNRTRAGRVTGWAQLSRHPPQRLGWTPARLAWRPTSVGISSQSLPGCLGGDKRAAHLALDASVD